MQPDPVSPQLEELSARVLRFLPRSLWHELFVEGNGDGVRFEDCTLTLLFAQASRPVPEQAAALLQREMRWLAGSHQGKADPSAGPDHLVMFKNPKAALRMALALQNSEQNVQFKVGIHTGRCTLALFEAEGRQWALALGPERDEAIAVSAKAVAGTVIISGGTCKALGDALDEEVGGALVSEEFEGAELVQATVILPPKPTAFQSSFAGLGLT
ncbi:hypothetical protein HHL11_29065 [Ramlibacter sp. G-1-2-2]|uniref:Adenylate/guanylate cyclase domain-containing protein n=1 Tax=Ramlibacter agri TaxID=2728837 RepID=A0A848HAM1_9BURK|nr:hypothetical protein [Ramlibacter agri]NML47835.1 hypothetical protein [Ramlibacter agri]